MNTKKLLQTIGITLITLNVSQHTWAQQPQPAKEGKEPESTQGTKLIEGKGFRVNIPDGWVRQSSEGKGIDLLFTKDKDKSVPFITVSYNLYVPPTEKVAYEKEIEDFYKNSFPDMTHLSASKPKVNGTLLVNLCCSGTNDGKTYTLRYYRVRSGRTDFFVQSRALATEWPSVEKDCEQIVESIEAKDSIFVAVMNSNTADFTKWIKQGVDLSEPYKPGGMTVLYYAANNGKEDMVKLLLKAVTKSNSQSGKASGAPASNPTSMEDNTYSIMKLNLQQAEWLRDRLSDMPADTKEEMMKNMPDIYRQAVDKELFDRCQRIQKLLQDRLSEKQK